ncbi:TRAP-type C4-dicarboxylate transport system, substrate-binding protein [Desulfotomaculum arcticum]|uniref:TRAP-type C4-dicarboxylate transport system, substrate-binding protein n=1 Tax=Desulfotruncus arcticus DSM 17038 TaxID=1121424 RepID=A0A1I2XRN2_9FIRM|nr:TRAP transporter substrate-binding protein [Desulfotruncus arcticus]SFH15739.1 TRAP-type C4-dicarboxylate transport system, substrate-binding protein [Desulfotomaculum arcticum] [Desulfotruncus arcticus DSM 17038]
MQKRLVFFLIAMLAVVTILTTACGNSGNSNGSSDSNQQAAENKTYTLNLNCSYPPPTHEWESKYIAHDEFAKRVSEATNGQVIINIFYNSQLAPNDQALDALKKGVIDMESSTSYWGGTVPESDVIWLPFWSKGHQHAMHVMRETKVGQMVEEAYQKQGVKLLFYWPVSIEGLISTKPIASYDDIKGIKLRMGSSMWPTWYKSMGVTPINIDPTEQYEAMMRGTMDGTIYVLYSIDTYKFYEVAKNLTLPGFIDPFLCYVLVNEDKWNALPEDLQKTIEQVAADIEKEAIQGSEKLTDSILQMCDEKGVTVSKLSKEDFNKFKESAMPLWDEFAARNANTAEMVNLLKDDIQQWEAQNPDSKNWEERWLSQ